MEFRRTALWPIHNKRVPSFQAGVLKIAELNKMTRNDILKEFNLHNSYPYNTLAFAVEQTIGAVYGEHDWDTDYYVSIFFDIPKMSDYTLWPEELGPFHVYGEE